LIKQFAPGTITVKVKGHADATGEDPINDPLSKERSAAVREVLSMAAGVAVSTDSCGKYCPVASNDTVEGRSHNRRVEISITAKGKDIDWPSFCKLFPQICLCLFNPLFCDDDDGGIDWPSLCSGTVGKFICLGILCLFTGSFCLSAICRLLPELCLMTFCKAFPSLCKDKRKRKKDDPERKRACPTKVNLPSGVIEANKEVRVGAAKLSYPFPMEIDFAQDPATGCECSCGEYQQLVRGFFERDDKGTGVWKRYEHELSSGVYMHPREFREDGTKLSGGYGHRFLDDATRKQPKKNEHTDKFLTTRETGCEYRGLDEPFLESAKKYRARIRMYLEFVGGPVDVCLVPGQRIGLQEHWHSWVIHGEAQAASPPSMPPKPQVQQRAFVVRSGLPSNPQVGVEELMLEIAVRDAPAGCVGKIPATIIMVDPSYVTVFTHNDEPVQISPDACPDVWILPYQSIMIFR
jgi:hypothetical protein